MKNININLTADQAKMVDQSATNYGFANRSEFFRAILRYIFLHSPQILAKLDAATFEQPPIRDSSYIVSELAKSGKHSKAFVASVARGLKKSDYFNQ
ncbi:MAG: hypothetical protein HY395_01660 [Candidatus Doudnabacteria bacterium]|nr:hypothetical protein [Candidatus Doudnabacteria bacterium]